MARTTKIASFDRTSTAAVQAALLEAMQGVAKKFGISVKQAGGSIGGTFAILKFEVATTGEDGAVQSRDASEFKMNSKLYGVPGNMLNKVITLRNEGFKLIGLRVNSSKFPFVVERVRDGKTFVFTEVAVQRAIATMKQPKATRAPKATKATRTPKAAAPKKRTTAAKKTAPVAPKKTTRKASGNGAFAW